jgi:hypothetical protein
MMPEVKEDDSDDPKKALFEYHTFVIIDTVKTSNGEYLSAHRINMPEYTHHSACGVEFRKAVYIVGGEIEGKWSRMAYRLNYSTFMFDRLEDLPETIIMPSLATINHKDISFGFFFAG